MILSEQEARNKWCPFARVRSGVNRHYDGTIMISTCCIASECMAWRSTDDDIDIGYCGLIDQTNQS